jgi:hypothetical protein
MQKVQSIVFIFAAVLFPTLVLGQASVEIADETTIVGEQLLYPVELINEGNEVTGVNFHFSYDTLALDYVGISETGTISDSVLSIANGGDGIVRFSLASTYPVQMSGTLVHLEFISKTSGDTQVNLREYRINENDIIEDADSARIRVFSEGGNQPPFAVNIPDTLVLFSGDTLRFNLDETLFADAEDAFDELDILVTLEPEVVFGTFDEESGLVTITTVDYVGFATLSIRVEDTDGGVFEESIVLDIQMGVSNELEEGSNVARFQLSQNYPNPFNPSTNIAFSLYESGFTTLEVYNLQGQKVATLVKHPLNAGSHSVTFDASALASGIYIYRLTIGSNVLTKKMLLIK